MDKRLRDVFFQLLRIGLWGKETFKLTQPLSSEDWSRIFHTASKHTVEGIIYNSLNFLDFDFLPPPPLRLKWAVRIDTIERHNKQMNQVLASQYKDFTENGFQPILMKGQGVAYFYKNPEHRICGDIDWYFEDKLYPEARDFLKRRGINVNDTAGFSLDYDLEGVHIEHHKNLFDIRSPFKSNYLKKLQASYRDRQQQIIINNIPINILAPELQLLQVNAHILKHLIFFGVGLRQLCDSAYLYMNTITKIDKQALKNMYKKTGILEWIHLLHVLLVKYLGLPVSALPFPLPENENADWMLEEIWHGGNFGYYDDRYIGGKVLTSISVHPNGTKRLWNNFKRYFPYAPQEAFFIPSTYLYSRWFGIDRD